MEIATNAAAAIGTVLVTGAAGKSGSLVLQQLRARGVRVRALVRTRDARSNALSKLGAEIVVGDMTDYAAMQAAMEGCQRAYFCPPIDQHMMAMAVAFAAAARHARVDAVVVLSQWLASHSSPSFMSREHAMADDLLLSLAAHGIAVTVLNPGFFADLPYMALLPYAIHFGVYPLPVDGDSKNAPPSVEDIARCATAVLAEPDAAKHAGKTYRPTGPELLSASQMVTIISKVLGRRVRHVQLPIAMLNKAMRMDGYPLFVVANMGHYVREHSAGSFAVSAPTDVVQALTGKPAESFEAITRRFAALPANAPTAGNYLAALWRFLILPMSPGLDADEYDRRMGIPRLPSPRLAVECDAWLATHKHT